MSISQNMHIECSCCKSHVFYNDDDGYLKCICCESYPTNKRIKEVELDFGISNHFYKESYKIIVGK